MSVNANPSSPDTQPAINESTQATETQTLDQEIKKEDSTTASDQHDNTSSSSSKFKSTHETHQTTTLTSNKNADNPSTPEFEHTTDESTKSIMTTYEPTNVQSSHEPHQTTTLDTNENDTISTTESEIHQVADPPTETSTNTRTIIDPNISSREIKPVKEPPTQRSTTNEISESAPDPDPDQDRKQLVNLIDQELNFITNTCPKLGKHQDHIQKEATDIQNIFENLRREPCELKELKDMKKTITKLKLQIPAKYRTYEENDQQRNKQSNVRVISSKFLKNMPHLHTKLYHQSPFCKSVQQRYDTLNREEKLCLLCFSVFPENAIISRRLMVYWWIGEGLIPSDDEDYANDLFERLMNHKFFEPVSKRHGCNVATCKIHPMVRAALVMIADQVKFFEFDEYGNPKDFGKFDEIETPEDVPEVYPLGDPRVFFNFFDENRKPTFEEIIFVDSKGNPIPFSVLHPDENVDSKGNPIPSSVLHPDENVDSKGNPIPSSVLHPDENVDSKGNPIPSSVLHPDEHVDSKGNPIPSSVLHPDENVDSKGNPIPSSVLHPDENVDSKGNPIPSSVLHPDEHVDSKGNPIPSSVLHPDENVDSKGNPIPSSVLHPDENVDSKGIPIPFSVLHPDENVDTVHRDEKAIDTNKKHYFYTKKKITTESYKVCLMGSGLSKGVFWEKLHTLFNVKDDILEFKPEWFLRMKNVNVVSLGRWQSSAAHHIEVEDFRFEESLEHMKHVRFFSLQGVSRISKLPKSISNLENLLILDLRACHNLDEIPKTIGFLKNLTHLDMSDCYLLEHMPKEISSLESLQVLKGFVVVESPGRHTCTVSDLKKLGNLRKLSMYTHMKDFPQESHLDGLQKLETLRKLTILWGSHESKNTKTKRSKTVKANQNEKLVTKVMKLIPRKEWVKGSMRRMNAFNSSTLGSRLEKLDLKCYPKSETPNWLTPGNLKGLKKLYIRGGHFSDVGQYQELDWDDSPIPAIDTWNVEVLRLKYLDEIKMDWKELQDLFPKMYSLEKVKCPRLTLFPCNERGIWIKKTST